MAGEYGPCAHIPATGCGFAKSFRRLQQRDKLAVERCEDGMCRHQALKQYVLFRVAQCSIRDFDPDFLEARLKPVPRDLDFAAKAVETKRMNAALLCCNSSLDRFLPGILLVQLQESRFN